MRRSTLTRSAAALVKYLIDDRGLTVMEIAKICGVDKSYISRCKRGEREFGTGHIERIADAVGVLPGSLMIAATAPATPHPDPEVRKLQASSVTAMKQFDQFIVSLRQANAPAKAKPEAA